MSSLDKIFGQTARLPHVSSVVQKVAVAIEDDGVSTAELALLVSQDQALSVKVLRMANSSFYGMGAQVSSIDKAIQVVGLKSFLAIAVTSGLMNAFDDIPGMDMNGYWRHSVLSGLLCQDIAQQAALNDPGAYAAGLMHGIGVLLIHLCAPAEARAISREAPGFDFPGRIPVEREVLGFDHAQVASEILKRWKFPAGLRSAISNYPLITRRAAGLPRLVFIASVLAEASLSDRDIRQTLQGMAQITADRHLDLDWMTATLEKHKRSITEMNLRQR